MVAILCGMLFALIPAILKAKCNVNEMVVTLMLNYAMAKTLEFLTTGIFRDKSAGYVATPTVQDAAMFQRCRTDFADIQNKKECGGNRQWQNHYLRNWAANTKGKGII